MRMNFLCSPVFWGVVFILWGCSIVLNVVFHLDIPVFRILIALIIVFFGIQMMLGWKSNTWAYVHDDEHNIIFGRSAKKVTPSTKEYNIIFSNGEVDITDPNPEWVNAKLELNTVFGSGLIRINPEIPVKIVSNAAFALMSTPDNQQSVMGDHVYQTPAVKENQPYLLIKASVVFGNLGVQLQSQPASV